MRFKRPKRSKPAAAFLRMERLLELKRNAVSQQKDWQISLQRQSNRERLDEEFYDTEGAEIVREMRKYFFKQAKA
jgi:hypothetical protein